MPSRRRALKRTLLYSAISVFLLASRPGSAQTTDDLLSDWLLTDCETGVEGVLESAISQSGTQLVSSLVQAAQNGPDSSLLLQIQNKAGQQFDAVMAYLGSGGGNEIGLTTADIQGMQQTTRADFVAQQVNDAVLSYETRAVVGLGIIGGPTALQALQSLAQNTASPLQAVAQDALQHLQANNNTTPTVSVGANQIIECSSSNGTPVTVSGSASDPDGDSLTLVWKNSIGTVVGTTPTISQILPLGTFSYSFTATDTANLSSTATTNVAVRDTKAPSLSLSKSTVTLVIPTASASTMPVSVTGIASAADICDPNPTISNNAPSLFPIGTTNVTFTAADHSGNASRKSLTIDVEYSFGGINPPIPNAVFSVGQAIPVKFQLFAADHTVVSTAIAHLEVFRVTSTGMVPAIVVAVAASNSGTLFRYDRVAKQYVYTLSTNGYLSGTYLLRATLNDGTHHDASILIH
jgi:hypothetical protein